MGTVSIITKWNMVDTIIFKLENLIKDSRDELPDTEEMINAATEELRRENDELKSFRMPGKLVPKGGSYACPNCGREAGQVIEDDVRYCPGCGKRIVLPTPTPYERYRNNVNNMV
jgi:DNA-directed RNA polymerase subunit RPC12/RpoP